MGNLKEKLERVKFKDILAIGTCVCAIPYALYLKKKRPDMWLICEDYNEARDNGYWLFKYIREQQPQQDVVYAINKKSVDYNRVKDLGEIIQYSSYKHWAYYLAASKNISSQKGGKPNAAVCYLLEVYGILKNARVFLQHGVICNDMPWCYYENTKMRLFVCGALKEYNFIRDTYGYPEGYVKYLGLTRFDGLHDFKVKKNQVLVMPSWREWIATPTSKSKELDSDVKNFVSTDYYQHWNAVLNSEKIDKILKEYNLELIFYPHRNMQKYIEEFKTNSENITIADWKKYDVQGLLKESALLITDLSSIFMDFGYMRKPMIYYQFDMEKFRKGQYQQGYFEYKRDGFGPVCETLEELEKALEKLAKRNLQIEETYLEREKEFFPLWDTENCKRNYEAIKSLEK